MKDFALNELKEKLPGVISALIQTYEDEVSLKWVDDNEGNQIIQDIKNLCDEFYYNFQELPYVTMQEYRHNYINKGKEVADRYAKQVEWLFNDNLQRLNETISEYDSDFLSDVIKQTADIRDFEFLLPETEHRHSLRYQAIQINGIYSYLKSNLGLADITTIGVSIDVATKNDKQGFETLFNSSESFALCKKVLVAVEVFDELGNCILTPRTGFKLFAAIEAMKRPPGSLRIFKKDNSDLQLLGYFNEFLGTQYAEIKRDSKGYKQFLPIAKSTLNG